MWNTHWLASLHRAYLRSIILSAQPEWMLFWVTVQGERYQMGNAKLVSEFLPNLLCFVKKLYIQRAYNV